MPQPMRVLEKPSKAVECGMCVPRKSYVAGYLHPGEGQWNRLGDTCTRHNVVQGGISWSLEKVRGKK